MRLDKLLALSGERSRSEAARAVHAGLVCVNGVAVRDPAAHVSERDEVIFASQSVAAQGEQYYLLHKPAGVLTAARDSHAQTVMDLLPEALRRRKVLPVGRLDKDTTGLLLLTNDGELAHRLLSPKHHVWKQYLATVEGRLCEEDVLAFSVGMALSDFVAKPAELIIVRADEQMSQALVSLREGKFHQVKRMFSARGHEVLTLHRSAFGPLTLPEQLEPGAYRALTQAEVEALKRSAQRSAEAEEGIEDDD
ncbi:MAG: pseudouridine synthase [Clostridia bacterium]